MSRIETLEPAFVEEIPSDLTAGTLYISIEYTTAVHLCCCGCGAEVVTPLHPTRWTLAYDGETVSLDPSVGSWGLPCQSHYFIKRNRVRWAPGWSKAEIEAGRDRQRGLIEAHYSSSPAAGDPQPVTEPPASFLARLRRRLVRLVSRG